MCVYVCLYANVGSYRRDVPDTGLRGYNFMLRQGAAGKEARLVGISILLIGVKAHYTVE